MMTACAEDSLVPLPPVGELFGTFDVSVEPQETRATGMPRALAAQRIALVLIPWPISQPPWEMSTVPSLYTDTVAPEL